MYATPGTVRTSSTMPLAQTPPHEPPEPRPGVGRFALLCDAASATRQVSGHTAPSRLRSARTTAANNRAMSGQGILPQWRPSETPFTKCTTCSLEARSNSIRRTTRSRSGCAIRAKQSRPPPLAPTALTDLAISTTRVACAVLRFATGGAAGAKNPTAASGLAARSSVNTSNGDQGASKPRRFGAAAGVRCA